MKEMESRVFLNDFLRGCGNHACLVNPPKGQGTNAGCSCHMKLRELHKHNDPIGVRIEIRKTGAFVASMFKADFIAPDIYDSNIEDYKASWKHKIVYLYKDGER